MAFAPGYDHDVFVSYAHIDDEPLTGATDGWVTTLVSNLITIVRQKLGDREGRLKVWFDAGLAGNTPFPLEIEKALTRTATLLVVMSPGYLTSDWCRTERESFRRVAASRIRAGSRLFIVHRDRIDLDTMPKEFGGLLGYPFWVENGPGRPSRTLGVPVPTPADREYYDQVTQLGSELADELRRLQTAEAAPAADPGRVVFLAEVTDDLDPRREEIRRYLSQAGMSVVPTVYYPHDDAAAFAKAMTADLARSKLFVQLLGALPGRKPPAAPNGFPTLQYELAQRQGIAILQWTSRDLELAAVEDPQQRALLEATTVRACPIEELKRTIVEELQRKPATPRERPGDALIFVNSDDADRLLAEHICAILGGGGVGYSLPMRAGDPAEVRSDLEDNLRTCDGLLLVYGVTTPAWIRSQLRQCRKVLSQREQPIAALAVFEGPPPDKVDFDVMLPSMQRLDCRKGLDQDLLKRFIRSLRP